MGAMKSKKGKVFYRTEYNQLVLVASDPKENSLSRCPYNGMSYEVMYYMGNKWGYSDSYCNFDPSDPEDPFIEYGKDPKLVGGIMHEFLVTIFKKSNQ